MAKHIVTYPVDERLQEQREELFGAMSMVAVARDSVPEENDHLSRVLNETYERLDRLGWELAEIADKSRGTRPARELTTEAQSIEQYQDGLDPLLTPERAARRFRAVSELDPADCGTVLAFLRVTRPLKGCEYKADERMEYADRALRIWIELCLTQSEGRRAQDFQDLRNPMAAMYDAATIANWLANIEPIEGESFCRGDEIASGFIRVSELIDIMLLDSLGMLANRPHSTTMEKERQGSTALAASGEASP